MKSDKFDLVRSNELEPLNGSHRLSASLSDDLLLIQWLEKNPDYVGLVKRSRRQGWFWNLYYSLNPKPPIVYILGFLQANPRHFDGEAFVPRDVRRDSEITADIVSGATLINAITNFPILLFAFKGLGNIWVAPVASFVLNLIVLNWTNLAGTATAGNRPGKKYWAQVGFAGFLLMSILQSFVAGIGSELINNRPALSYKLAEELIEEHDRKIRQVEPDTDAYERTFAQCQQNLQLLSQIPRTDPRWDSLYVETNGSVADRERDWSRVPAENLPLCQKADRIRSETFAVREDWEEKLKIRSELGNDLIFLNRELPLVFSRYFNEYGEITSGVEEVRLASSNFFGNLFALNFSRLGFSLFFFLLSTITSITACYITVAHARGRNTKISHNPEVEAAVREWLETIRQMNLNRHRPNPSKEERYEERLIARFTSQYRKTGICDYPVLEGIAYRAHQGTLFLPEQQQLISDEIDRTLDDIYKAVSALEYKFCDLQKFIAMSDPEIIQKTLKVEMLMKSDLKLLFKALHYLLDKAHKYAVSNYGQWEYLESDDAEKARKLIKQIVRIRKALNREAHVNWVMSKPTEFGRSKACQRVRQKLDVLPGYCYELGYITQQKLLDKVVMNPPSV